MKKRSLISFFLFVLGFSLFGCAQQSTVEILNLPEKVNVGASIYLLAQITPASDDNSVIWSVDNQRASINDQGLFIPLEYGKVTVTATSKSDPLASVSQSTTVVKTAGRVLTLLGQRNLLINQEYLYTLEDELPLLVEDYLWESQNPTLLEVLAPGQLKAIGVGQASLLVTNKIDPLKKITALFNISLSIPTSLDLTGPSFLTLDSSPTSYTAVVLPTDAYQGIEWSSSNPSIASISETGEVTPLRVGTTVITATSAFNPLVADSIELIITDVNPQEIIIDGLATLTLSSESQYFATVLPASASQTVIWSTSDESIATIDAEGYLTALEPGELDIIATSQIDSSISASYAVVISYDLPTEITIDGLTHLFLSSSASLYIASVYPITAEQLFTWSSLNSAIATIDQNGELIILQTGSVTIRATSTIDNSIYCDYLINIAIDAPESISINGLSQLYYSEESTLYTASILPGFALQDVEWTSSNPSTGTIASDGTLTIIGIGTTTITATSVFDSSITAHIILTVIPDLPESVLINGQSTLILGQSDGVYTAEILPITAISTGSWSFTTGSNLVSYQENDNTITLHALQTGTVTIRFTTTDTSKYYEKSISIEIPDAQNINVTSEIYNHQIYVGESFLLEWEITPIYAIQQVTYSSNYPGIVSVTNAGLITALTKGDVIIRITSQDSHATLDLPFTVYDPIEAAQNFFEETEDTYFITIGRIEYTITPSGLKSKNLDTGEISYEVYNDGQNVVELLLDASFHPSNYFFTGIYRSKILDLDLYHSLYPTLDFSWNPTHRNIIEITGGTLYRLAQNQYPDATLKLTIEISDGVEFAEILHAKYYYGSLEIASSSLLLGQSPLGPESFCETYLEQEFSLDGELTYLDFRNLNYMNLMTRLGYPRQYIDQLQLTQEESYWIWFKAVPNKVDETRLIFGGYEFRLYDYYNSNFEEMLSQYEPINNGTIDAYWAFDYSDPSGQQTAFIVQSTNVNPTILWIYQSNVAIDNLNVVASWNLPEGIYQIIPGVSLNAFYNILTRTVTISTKESSQEGLLQTNRQLSLEEVQNGGWALRNYFIPNLYLQYDGNYGVVISPIFLDDESGMSFFTIQLLTNPPATVDFDSYPEITLPERYSQVNFDLIYTYGSIIFTQDYLSYQDGYPTLILRFLGGRENTYYSNLENFLNLGWNIIEEEENDYLYEYQEDPSLRLLITKGPIIVLKFFTTLPPNYLWPEEDLNTFLGIEIPTINSNPEKYHFFYEEGTVTLVIAAGYEAEMWRYAQSYVQKLEESYTLFGSYRTSWSQIYNFDGFELEIVLNHSSIDFTFRRETTFHVNELEINLNSLLPAVSELDFLLTLSQSYQVLLYENSTEIIFFQAPNSYLSNSFYGFIADQLNSNGFHDIGDETTRVLTNDGNCTLTFSPLDPTTGRFSIAFS